MSSTNRRERGGAGLDQFPTPRWCVHRLLDQVGPSLPTSGRWLEPCAGAGNVVRAVDEYLWGRGQGAPRWTGIDVDPRYEGDWGDLRGELVVGDFLREWDRLGRHSVVVTNPPYKLAHEFLDRCLRVSGVTCLLLRVGFLEGGASPSTAARSRLLYERTPDVYLLPNRPSFDGRGNDSATYAWMVWGLRSDGEPARFARLGQTTRAERGRG